MAKARNQKRILITGATGQIGLSLLNSLDARGHEVFTLQRKPPPGVDQRPHLGANWLQANLEYADEMVAAFHPLVEQGVQIDAVVHLAFRREPIDWDLLSPADIERAFKVNVINPLMLIKYMLDFGVLVPNGLVIFPLDNRAFSFDQVPTSLSVASRQAAVEAFFRCGHQFSHLKVAFAEYLTNDAELDLSVDQIRRNIETDPELVSRVIRIPK